MSESLARIHVHELAANDNEESIPMSRSTAANDNEIGLVAATSPVESSETAQMLSETRSRLGLTVETPAIEEGSEEEPAAPEELPQLKPERIQEIEESAAPEKVAVQSAVESTNMTRETSAAQSAGGTSDNEGGGNDDGSSGESGNVFVEGGDSRNIGGGKVFSSLGKILKYALLAPLWAFGALFALGMKGVVFATNKIFDFAKLSKGGGNGGSGGSKPSGGSGGHH